MSEARMDLPPGYTVSADIAVGYTYYDANGKIVLQHPVDNDAARKLVWHYYYKRGG